MSLPGEAELNRMIDQARDDFRVGDQSALEDLYSMLMPYCLRIIAKICGKFVSDSDEEASIGRLAFLEALRKYEPERGNFTVFLGRVVRNRIIDFKRKEKKRYLQILSFSYDENSTIFRSLEDSFFTNIIDDLARQEQIEKLRCLLAELDISFTDLASASPRQAKTRQEAKRIAYLIANDPEASCYFQEKKLLPVKLMEEKWQVKRKTVERYRKFIIAGVLINQHDLFYLKPYVLPEAGGDC